MPATPPYQHPVDQILRLNERTHWSDTWLDYVGQYGLTIADSPELIRLCWDLDPQLVPNGEDDVELTEYCAIHGLRALTQLDPRAGIALFLELLSEFPEDDFVREEAEGMGRHTGAEAIEPLAMFLADVREDVWSRNATITTLEQLGISQPELRDRIVQLLMALLRRSKTLGEADEQEILVANLISGLIKLKATEAADLLAEVFATGDVDEWVTGSWPAAQVELGLKHSSDFSPEELEPTPPDYIMAIREAQNEKQLLAQMASNMLEFGRSVGPSRSISISNPSMTSNPRKPASPGFGSAQSGKKAKKKKR